MALNELHNKSGLKYIENNLVVTDFSQREQYVFISYASDNWEAVFKNVVVPLQKEYGLRVYAYADKAFNKADDRWIVPMLKNIRGADAVIAFVSQSYIESYTCFLELLTAVNQKKQIVFVPLEQELHLADSTDLLDVERGIKKEILNQGANIFTNANSTSNELMRAMKSAYTSISTLLEQDALSKCDISDAFLNFIRDVSINKKTINDLETVKYTIDSVSNEVFDVSQTSRFDKQKHAKILIAMLVSFLMVIGVTAAVNLFGNVKNKQYVSQSGIMGNYTGSWHRNGPDGQGTMIYANGAVYEGEWNNGKYNGQGTYTWANGDIYEGKWKDSKRNGQGTMTWANGDVYEGKWKDDKKNSQGTLTYADGGVYEGEWENDVRNGQGTYKWANGDIYEGEWKDDKRDGRGTKTMVSGDVYEGEWKDNKYNGQGTYKWANGDVYEGEWKDDKRDGRGTRTMVSGDVYEGEWKDNKYNGQGTYKWANGSIYEGEWKDDKRDGQGILTMVGGNAYEGEWKDDKYDGQGTYKWANGDVYEGEWKDGQYNGQGTLTKADGTVQSGTWKSGELVD